jgi:gliding motility-associated lipoprotein GldD
MKQILIFIFLYALTLTACDDTLSVPKPRAYPRVIYPERAYKPFDEKYCAFTFDQPVYAKIEQDTSYFGQAPANACWFNMVVPQLNAQLHCSYFPIRNQQGFDELIKDAFELTNKHNIKADYIDEIPIHRPADRVHGLLFKVEGSAASTYQFFLTDSTRHFVRGALYFNTPTRPDSLAPVIRFMKQDLDRMVNTLRWNDAK